VVYTRENGGFADVWLQRGGEFWFPLATTAPYTTANGQRDAIAFEDTVNNGTFVPVPGDRIYLFSPLDGGATSGQFGNIISVSRAQNRAPSSLRGFNNNVRDDAIIPRHRWLVYRNPNGTRFITPEEINPQCRVGDEGDLNNRQRFYLDENWQDTLDKSQARLTYQPNE
ncbi:MAG: hypothetical protein ACR2QC_09985, partial [Gammaproteobacteria bacterium]